MKKLSESIWTDMQKRSSGEETRMEDDVNLLDLDGLYDYIKSKYEKRLFYLDKDTFGINNKRNIVVDVMANISLFTNYNKSGKFDHILLSWTKEKIAMPFFDKLKERFNVQIPNANRRTITEKDGTCTNQTYIDVIDFFLDNIDNMLVNESVWTDMQKRSSGEETRMEDDVDILDAEGFFQYLKDHYDSKKIEFRTDSGRYYHCFLINILRLFSNVSYLLVYNFRKKKIEFNSDLEKHYPDLFTKMNDTFQISAEDRNTCLLHDKDWNVTNSLYIKALNFIIDNVENKEDLLINRK